MLKKPKQIKTNKQIKKGKKTPPKSTNTLRGCINIFGSGLAKSKKISTLAFMFKTQVYLKSLSSVSAYNFVRIKTDELIPMIN